MQENLVFALAVFKQELPDGKIKFEIHAENKKLPTEVMLTLMRHWLRTMDDTYHDSFEADSLI